MLRAARESAGITPAHLATKVGMPEGTICAWEQGSRQLALAPAADVDRLQTALRAADGRPELVADLEVAACCDLVALAISEGDASVSQGKPPNRQTAFAEMLAWSVVGRVPVRYRSGQGNPGLPPDEDEQDE